MPEKNAVYGILCCIIVAPRYNVSGSRQPAKQKCDMNTRYPRRRAFVMRAPKNPEIRLRTRLHIGNTFRVQSIGSISGLTTFCVDFA